MKNYFIIAACSFCLAIIIFPQSLAAESLRKGNVAVLTGPLPEYNQDSINKLAGALQKRQFNVTLLTAEQVCDEQTLSTNRFFAFIIPNASSYPLKGYPALESYAKQGGNIIFTGGPAFKNPIYKIKNKWLALTDIKTKLKVKNQHPCFNLNKPVSNYGWTRSSLNLANTSLWEIVDDSPEPGLKSYHFLCKNFEGWDNYTTKKLDKPLFEKGDNLLCFYAKSGLKTPQISVELQEEDGSRWIASVMVNTNWQQVFLPLASFKYWKDSVTKNTRGDKNDEVQPGKVRHVNFGLSFSHTPSSAANTRHEFLVSKIGTAHDIVISKILSEVENTPVFETISPSYKTYPLVNIDKAVYAAPWQSPTNVEESTLKIPRHGISAIPRTQGRGFNRNQKWRYISLIDALDAKGQQRGSLFWLLLNNKNSDYPNACFVGLASSESNFLNSKLITDALVKVLNHLSNGILIIDAGANHFSFWPGEQIELGANLLRFGNNGKNSVLRFIVENSDGSVILNRDFNIDFQGKQNFTTNFLWTAPEHQKKILKINVSVLTNGKLVDKISHEIGFLHTNTFDKNDFVKTKGNQFILHGKPWYPVGVNYWPTYVSGMDGLDFFAGWLIHEFYSPKEVERDLILMEKLGVNMLSIQGVSVDSRGSAIDRYRELLDFLRRCASHNIKINLYLHSTTPLDFREKELQKYIEQAKLTSNPTLFAYDIIWEPGNYVFDKFHRPRWDKDWRKWIVDNYGSVDAAEKDWDVPVPRDDKGNIISPPDKYFRDDGNWRVMMAAYRRFMNNLMSHKWNYACSTLRKFDPNHLISFRQGNTLPHDFTFTATPKHIDFICPEGYSIKNSEDGFDTAGFITRFVHFTTGGKPILWAEFGKHVWDKISMRPSEKLIKEQSNYNYKYYKMILKTGANGLAPWWWPGGYRVDEHSDYGIIEPDRRLRPTAEYIAKFAPQIKAFREWPKADKILEIDLDEHSGGYWYLCFNKGKKAYRKARLNNQNLGIRTRGTDTTSASTPLVAVGNRPYNGHNPPKYLDAEFNWFKVLDANSEWINATNGSVIEVMANQPVRVKVSVGNTQEAAWLPPSQTKNNYGAVYLASTKNSDISFERPINKTVPHFGDVNFGELTLCKLIKKPVKIELRMKAKNRCAFGEIRRFVLKP